MNVGELIERLKKFPEHYEVDVFFYNPETDELTADIVDVLNFQPDKIVLIEIAHQLLPP